MRCCFCLFGVFCVFSITSTIAGAAAHQERSEAEDATRTGKAFHILGTPTGQDSYLKNLEGRFLSFMSPPTSMRPSDIFFTTAANALPRFAMTLEQISDFVKGFKVNVKFTESDVMSLLKEIRIIADAVKELSNNSKG